MAGSSLFRCGKRPGRKFLRGEIQDSDMLPRNCYVSKVAFFLFGLIDAVSFSPVHTTTHIRIENGLKLYILLHSSSITFLATSCPTRHHAKVCPSHFQNRLASRFRARGATLKVGGLTSDSKWGGGGRLKTLLPQ